jgi:hypothetical protein
MTATHPRQAMSATRAHLDRLLDEALQQTFPASDPVAIAVERRAAPTARRFAVGDHVSWNSEAGRVRGRIVRVHTRDVTWKGYVRHADQADPQYEIQSDKTDHVAMHKGRALRRLRR